MITAGVRPFALDLVCTNLLGLKKPLTCLMPWNGTSARLHRKHYGPGSFLQNISHCKLVTSESNSRETGSPRKTLRLRGRTIKLKTIIFGRVMKSGSRAEDNTELRWNMTKAMWSHTVALTHQRNARELRCIQGLVGVARFTWTYKALSGGGGSEEKEERKGEREDAKNRLEFYNFFKDFAQETK